MVLQSKPEITIMSTLRLTLGKIMILEGMFTGSHNLGIAFWFCQPSSLLRTKFFDISGPLYCYGHSTITV